MRLKATAALCASAMAVALAGCTGEDGLRAVPSAPPAPLSGRPLADFELYVQASAEGNIFFNDVYGLEFFPLSAHRLTSGKRISTMDANADHVVVAAADGDVDRLGYVQDDGQIGPIPGLGRPYAYAPTFDSDGSILYSDYQERADGSGVNRFFDWDPRTGKRVVVLKTPSDDVYGPIPGPAGQRAVFGKPGRSNVIVLRAQSGKEREIALPKQASSFEWGKRWFAVYLGVEDERYGVRPTDTILLNPTSGDRHRIQGWTPLAWTPDKTRVLLRRTTDPSTSELALLDPERPSVFEPLGTLPNFTIYGAAWVDRPG